MILLLALLLCISPALHSQDFADVLPDGDYYYIQYINIEAIGKIDIEKSVHADRYINGLKSIDSYAAPWFPNEFRFLKNTESIFLAGRVAVFDIIEDNYEKDLAEKYRPIVGHTLTYKDNDLERMGEIDEYLDTVVLVKVESLKQLAKKGLGREVVRNLRKGAIVAFGESVGTARAYLLLAGSDLLAIADNKNILSDIVRVKEGELPPLRGTAIHQFIRDNQTPDSLKWEFINNTPRIEKWREFAIKKVKSDALLDEIENAELSYPAFSIESKYYDGAFQEKKIQQFRSGEAAQKRYILESKKDYSRFGIRKYSVGGQYSFERSPLDRIKPQLELIGEKLVTLKTTSTEDFQSQIRFSERRRKEIEEMQRKSQEMMKTQKFKKLLNKLHQK